MTAREIERILRSNGFEYVSQKGSHRKWRHLEHRYQVVVPDHGGHVLPIGTIRNILANTGIPESEWKD